LGTFSHPTHIFIVVSRTSLGVDENVTDDAQLDDVACDWVRRGRLIVCIMNQDITCIKQVQLREPNLEKIFTRSTSKRT